MWLHLNLNLAIKIYIIDHNKRLMKQQQKAQPANFYQSRKNAIDTCRTKSRFNLNSIIAKFKSLINLLPLKTKYQPQLTKMQMEPHKYSLIGSVDSILPNIQHAKQTVLQKLSYYHDLHQLLVIKSLSNQLSGSVQKIICFTDLRMVDQSTSIIYKHYNEQHQSNQHEFLVLDSAYASIADAANCLMKNNINLIYTQTELSNIIQLYLNDDVEYMTFNDRYDVVTELLDTNFQIEQSIKSCIKENNGDLVVFVDVLANKEFLKQTKKIDANFIFCPDAVLDKSSFALNDKKVNVMIAQNYAQLMAVCKSQLNRVMRIFDFMKHRSIYFDYQAQIYVEELLDLSDEQYKKRRLIVGEHTIGKYYRKQEAKIIRNFGFIYESSAEIIIKTPTNKLQKLLSQNPCLKQSYENTARYLRDLGTLDESNQLNQEFRYIKNYTNLFVNQIISLQRAKSVSEYNMLLVIFSYIRTPNTHIFEKLTKLNDCIGDFGVIQEIIKKFGNLEKFCKGQINSKARKNSSNSAQLDDLSLDYAQSSELKEISISKGQSERNAGRYKFNLNFVLQWNSTYKNMSMPFKSILESHIKIQDKSYYEINCQPNPLILSKNSKSYHFINSNLLFHIPKSNVLNCLVPLPKYLQVIKLLRNGNNHHIMISNISRNIPETSINVSYIEYHNITASIFPSTVLRKFQQENSCTIEINQQFQTLLIGCQEQHKAMVQTKFKVVLEECLSTLKLQSITAKHGNKDLLLELGGRIREISKVSSATREIVLMNLPTYWQLDDIKQLLQDVTEIEAARFRKNYVNQTNDAYLSVSKQQDILKVYEYLTGFKIDDHPVTVCKAVDIINPFLKDVKGVTLRWYVYFTNKTGQVHFEDPISVQNACKTFPKYCKYVSQQADSNILLLEGLEEWVDEQYIRQLLSQLGDIKKIRLNKIAPLEKEIFGVLYYHMGLALGDYKNYKISTVSISNQQSGQRQCFITVNDINVVDVIYNYFNSKLNLLGRARCYAEKKLEYTVYVSKSTVNMVKTLLKGQIENFNILNKKSFDISIYETQQQQAYLTIRANDTNIFSLILNSCQTIIGGYKIQPDQGLKCFSQYGLKAIKSIQDKFVCGIKLLNEQKKLSVICSKKDLQAIQKAVNQLQSNNIKITFKISNKVREQTNAEEEISKLVSKLKYKFDYDSRQVSLQGKFCDVVAAKQVINQFCDSINKKPSQSESICQICFEEFTSPFMLMICRHMFCRACLMEYVDTCLGNFQLFPIKCPKCSDPVSVYDLEELTQSGPRWEKMKLIAIKDFISRNYKQINHCLTPNCEGIHWIIKEKTVCEFCSKAYCMACKKIFHDGLTCWEAEVGSQVLFERYLKSNDVRKCPNPKCPALIQKNGGCNKVFCAMCKHSICWKCMKFYTHQDQAYAHLNEKHGGYFDN